MGFPVNVVADQLNRSFGGGVATWRNRVDMLSKAYAVALEKKMADPFIPGNGEKTVRLYKALESITGYSRSIVSGFLSALHALVEAGKVDEKFINPVLTEKFSNEFGVGKLATAAGKTMNKLLLFGALIAAGALIIDHQITRLSKGKVIK